MFLDFNQRYLPRFIISPVAKCTILNGGCDFFVPLFRIDHALFSDEYLIAQAGHGFPSSWQSASDNLNPLVREREVIWGAALFTLYNITKITLDSACLMAKISIY